MKAIKILITFVVILIGVVCAFWITARNDLNDPISIPDSTYETYRSQFESDWESKGDWDEQIFKSHCDLVHQLSTNYETTALNDLNTSTAVEIIFKNIFEKWKTASCQKSEIDRYIDALSSIEKEDENAKSNPNVKQIRLVNSVYSDAYHLSNQSIGLIPRFYNERWNSYGTYSNGVISKKDAILDNQNYKEYLSNITAIKEALNLIPQKLQKGKSDFYNKLAHEIVRFYQETSRDNRTRPQLNSLRRVRSRFDDEYFSNTYLNKFAKEFANDVERNESNND